MRISVSLALNMLTRMSIVAIHSKYKPMQVQICIRTIMLFFTVPSQADKNPKSPNPREKSMKKGEPRESPEEERELQSFSRYFKI